MNREWAFAWGDFSSSEWTVGGLSRHTQKKGCDGREMCVHNLEAGDFFVVDFCQFADNLSCYLVSFQIIYNHVMQLQPVAESLLWDVIVLKISHTKRLGVSKDG